MGKLISLAELSEMSSEHVNGMTTDEIRHCEKLISEEAKRLHKLAGKLYDAKHNRYYDDSVRALKASGKEYGTITTKTNMGDKVKVTIPKVVAWDQAKARVAVDALAEMGENVNDYVDFDVKISEAKWNAWPGKVKNLFMEARTTKPGKVKIEITNENDNDSENDNDDKE